MDVKSTDRLTRFGKVLNVIGIILAVFCLLATLSSFVVLIIVIVLPEGMVLNFFDSVDISSVFSVFQPGTVLKDLVPSVAVFGLKLAVVWAAIKSFIYYLICTIILFILSSLFRATAINHSPFLPKNVKRLKVIGVILIITSIFLGPANLIFALCLLALAFIFQYGTELQQQADETL